MIRPGLGELLEAIADVLDAEILPAHPDGPGVEQIKVARSMLRRFAAVWDRIVPTIEEDNRDLEDTLARLGALHSHEPFNPNEAAAAPSTEAERPYAAARSRSDALREALLRAQAVLDAAPATPELDQARNALLDYYERSLRRDAALTGRDFK